MDRSRFVQLEEGDLARALLAPHLGGWLVRYQRNMPGLGWVDALNYSEAIVERYPKEMYAGIPILFPFVSFNRAAGRDHHYEWNGRVFPMPQHGFARRTPWNVATQNSSSVTIELVENESIHSTYPFSFAHQITYSLKAGKLHWTQSILNRSSEPLPFGTGFHPYFPAPLSSRGQRNSCFVKIPAATRFLPDATMSSFRKQPFPAQDLSLSMDVRDTLFLGELSKREFVFVDPGSMLQITLNFEQSPNYPFVALWSKSTEEPFYCIEPWTSLPNVFGRTAAKDLVQLKPGEKFQASMWLELGQTDSPSAG